MVASKVSRTSGVSYILSILKGKTWMLPPLHMKPHGDHDNLLINTRMALAVCQALPRALLVRNHLILDNLS